MVSSPPWQEKEPYRGRNGPKLFSRIIYILLFAMLFHPLRLLSIRPPPTCVSNLHAFWEEKRKSLFKAALQWHCLKKKDVSAWKSSYFVPSEVCALALGTLIANSLLPHFARKSGLVRKKKRNAGEKVVHSTLVPPIFITKLHMYQLHIPIVMHLSIWGK